jgi:hypothetical protein
MLAIAFFSVSVSAGPEEKETRVLAIALALALFLYPERMKVATYSKYPNPLLRMTRILMSIIYWAILFFPIIFRYVDPVQIQDSTR